MLHKDLSEKIIKAFYNVYNSLGYGFLENFYENAMLIKLCKFGLNAQKQVSIQVYYEKELARKYYADNCGQNNYCRIKNCVKFV